MLRTVPPPEGIWRAPNVPDFGSNLTNVFGVTPDSLYQTSPSLVTAIPYGSELDPPGDGQAECACQDGYDDCDGETTPGCEIKLTTDAANCGVCGLSTSGKFIVCLLCGFKRFLELPGI